jgi:hypothetical protein
VRIHSFGYDSDWKAKGESTTTIHDFGQALLLALRSSECFSIVGTKSHVQTCLDCGLIYLNFSDVQNPIVLVVHSMGGIVAKEASILRLLLFSLQSLQPDSYQNTPWRRPTSWHDKILPAMN